MMTVGTIHRPGRPKPDIPVPFAKPREYKSLVADSDFGKMEQTILQAFGVA